MADHPKDRADARLESALEASDAPADPRPLFRPVLRHLRERDPEAFARAVAYLEETLIPTVAAGGDALAAWLDYGLAIASALGPGRTVEVDGSGKARDVTNAHACRGLLLYLPGATDAPVVALRHPRDPSPAQQATLELLVAGRVTATAYD
jgi:hypothetical protein